MVETHLTPRSLATGARGSGRLWPRQVTRKKTDRENRRRFSTTTRIKDNPIRLELIPGELHFTSAKYYVMPLLLYTAAAACFSFTAGSQLSSRRVRRPLTSMIIVPTVAIFYYYSTAPAAPRRALRAKWKNSLVLPRGNNLSDAVAFSRISNEVYLVFTVVTSETVI